MSHLRNQAQVWEPSRLAQRGGVVWISRRAHNPEIDGSNPSLAILIKPLTTLKKRDNP